ncbi:hypothetical protein HNR19_004099 [Nocardioides thalensis]|uniref:Uncharacterized protein n=1 Tax=Nocardioides thalensis TaxID=1914755 RepID=A0A853C8B9_9ACTN|nr:hypothetical protein [Nocardioides thalensis]NYJ03401.1 hypothetical protein [Nocardioides thalensis]
MTGRHPYTPEGFDAMTWELACAAIDRAIKDAVRAATSDPCFHGSPEQGYWFALDHARDVPHQPDLVPEDLRPAMVHYRLPPVTRARASTTPAVVEDYRGDPVHTFDPWGAPSGAGFHPQGFYARWADAIEEAFTDWDRLPDERDFWAAAREQRDAVRALAEVTEHAGLLFDLQWSLGVPGSSVHPDSAGPPPPMTGRAVEALTTRYVIPLEGTLVQQAWLAELVAAELDGLGDMWQCARRGVMDLGALATQVLRGQGTVEDRLDAISMWSTILSFVGLVPSLGPAAGLASVALLGVQGALEDMAEKRFPLEKEISVALSEASSSTIVHKIHAALQEVRNYITLEEGTAQGTIDIALGWSYQEPLIDPPDSYRTTFNLPGPEVVAASDPAEFVGPDEVAVDFPRLRRAGGHLSAIGDRVGDAAASWTALPPDNAIWLRPDRVGGVGRDGPFDAWKALRDRVGWLLSDTSGELIDAGDHVALAANALESADDEARAELRQHAEAVADVRSPDPAEPPP